MFAYTYHDKYNGKCEDRLSVIWIIYKVKTRTVDNFKKEHMILLIPSFAW